MMVKARTNTGEKQKPRHRNSKPGFTKGVAESKNNKNADKRRDRIPPHVVGMIERRKKQSQQKKSKNQSERDFVAEQIALRFNNNKKLPSDTVSKFVSGGEDKNISEDGTVNSDMNEQKFENNSDFIGFEDAASTSLEPFEAPNWENSWNAPPKSEIEAAKKNERSRSTPWTHNLDYGSYKTSIELLNAEMIEFNKFMSLRPSEASLRLWNFALIQRAIRLIWPDTKVQLVGSTSTNLLLPEGDLDLLASNKSWPEPPQKMCEDDLKLIARQLKRVGVAQDESIEILAKARVPIIKFIARFGGFSVDISFNTPSDVSAAETRNLVHEYSFNNNSKKLKELDNRRVDVSQDCTPDADYGVARTLILLLKTLFQQRGMNEVFTGGLGGYAIVLMVCSFLRAHPLIQKKAIDASEHIGSLLIEFLYFFGKQFNYDKVAITFDDAQRTFVNKEALSQIVAAKTGFGLRIFALTIMDPVDPMHDVSGGTYNLRSVIRVLQGAYEALTTMICARDAKQMDELKNIPNYDRSTQSQNDIYERSILGTIVGAPSTMIEQRREINDLVQSGQVQQLLVESGVVSSLSQIANVADESSEIDVYESLLNTVDEESPLKDKDPTSKAASAKKESLRQAFWASKR